MTGLQRNADVVRLASYAPLLANESHVQWTPGRDLVRQRRVVGDARTGRCRSCSATTSATRSCRAPSTAPVNAPRRHRRRRLPLHLVDQRRPTTTSRSPPTTTGATAVLRRLRRRLAVVAADRDLGGRAAVATCSRRTSVNDARSIVDRRLRQGLEQLHARARRHQAVRRRGLPGRLRRRRPPTTSTGGTSAAGTTPARCCSAPTAAAPREVKALEGTSVDHRADLPRQGRRRRHHHRALPRRRAADGLRPADASEKVFQVVTRDTDTGDLVAKVVNTSTAPVRTRVDVSDAGVEPTATVTTLSGAPTATNTKADAEHGQAARPAQVSGHLRRRSTYEFPASSVTFLRMHTVDAVAPVVGDARRSPATRPDGWYADPATVHVAATDDREVDHLEVSVDGGRVGRSCRAPPASVQVTGDGAAHRRRSGPSTRPATSARSGRSRSASTPRPR